MILARLLPVLVLVLVFVLVLILVLILVLVLVLGVVVCVAVAVVDRDNRSTTAAAAATKAAAESATKPPAKAEAPGSADHNWNTAAARLEGYGLGQGNGCRYICDRNHRRRTGCLGSGHDPPHGPGDHNAALHDLLGRDVSLGVVGNLAWPFCHVHGAAADYRTAARACAQFSQGHPNRHESSFSIPRHGPLDCKVRNKGLSASLLTTFLPRQYRNCGATASLARLTCQFGTARRDTFLSRWSVKS
jgi:hypothetical protein